MLQATESPKMAQAKTIALKTFFISIPLKNSDEKFTLTQEY
jgi:hypothetical protein